MNINEGIEAIKKNIIDQAKYFLENANEFFPFGAAVDKHDKIRPVSIYFGEEHPSALQVLEKLELALKDRIERNEYLYAAIGLDVYINTTTSTGIDKQTALEIRFYFKESTSKYYFLYFKKKNKYVFEEHISTYN